jgi:hypothetical protein
MSSPTQSRREYLSEEAIMQSDRITQDVGEWMKDIGRQLNKNRFIVERYYETKWHLRPKTGFLSPFFSSPTPYFVSVDMNKTKDGGSEYFGSAKYYLYVAIRSENGIPTDERIKGFCKELSDRTKLPVWCNPRGHELFHGYNRRT